MKKCHLPNPTVAPDEHLVKVTSPGFRRIIRPTARRILDRGF
jgi:hypothetical protein